MGKVHFEDLLNQTNVCPAEEAMSEDSVEDSSISLTEITEVIKKLHSGKAPGVDEICSEMLKAVDIVGLS